jgi:Rv2525c-like, glycoside hydrolase-like domain
MKEQLAFTHQTNRPHGRWFRQGGRIVLYLENSGSEEQEVGGVLDDGSKAIKNAIQGGLRDENRLTDTVFNSRHPERRGQPLRAPEQDLIREWLDIRDRLVRPALQAPSPARPAVGPGPAQPAAQPPSTTSGVEAAGNVSQLIPCILGLRDQGRVISFVQRYLRDLTRAEIAAIKKAGLRIVSCYEENGSDPQVTYFTRARGQYDGRRAFTQAQAIGQPAGTPIYFAIDTDPDIRQRQIILDYFQGVSDGFQQYLADMRAQNKQSVNYTIGVYGSGCVLGWCQTQEIATWFWQAFAPGWCNNRNVWPGANIHTSGRDTPERCNWRLGRLEGWGNEGGW